MTGLDLHIRLENGSVRAGLAAALREAIDTGRLAPGARLPASRALAADLGVGRNTVVRVYSELVAEGWLSARPGSGTEVARHAGGAIPEHVVHQPHSATPRPAHDLRPGHPDLSSFPRLAWLRAAKRAIDAAPNDVFGYGDPLGRVELRGALAHYLRRARGLRVYPDNVVVCNGAAEGLRLMAAVLAESGVGAVGVEEFGLPSQRRTLARGGLRTPLIPLDDHGANVTVLEHQPSVGAILLTPAHQFPLGVVLDPNRRAAVIDWARRRSATIIEDDYDGEFRYDRAAVGALQGLDPDHVVYLGTASKSLAPALRLGWLVVPDHLLERVRQQRYDTEDRVGVLEQLTMAEFIDSGGYDRHIRSMRAQYHRRRDQLVAEVLRLQSRWAVTGLSAGLHVVLEQLGSPYDPTAGRDGWNELAVEPLELFRHPDSTSRRNGVVVGFATPSPSAWSAALRALLGQLG